MLWKKRSTKSARLFTESQGLFFSKISRFSLTLLGWQVWIWHQCFQLEAMNSNNMFLDSQLSISQCIKIWNAEDFYIFNNFLWKNTQTVTVSILMRYRHSGRCFNDSNCRTWTVNKNNFSLDHHTSQARSVLRTGAVFLRTDQKNCFYCIIIARAYLFMIRQCNL